MRLSSSFKSSAKERAGFVVLVTLIASLAWLSHTSASRSGSSSSSAGPTFGDPAHQQNKRQKPPSNCTSCGPPGDQEIYIPLIDLPEAQGSEIVFNSRSPEAMDVTPVFYTRSGETVIADPVRIESAEIRYVNVMDLLPERYRQEKFGGFALKYYGFNREMWSQLRFLKVNGGNNVDEFFTVKDEARSDTYQAAWWAPEKSGVILALGNVSDVATSASVSLGNGRARTINLPPHATEVVREAHSNGESTGSVTINVTGAPGSIIPTGIVTTRDGSFNSVIRFYDPTRAKQSNLYANGFRVTGNTPHMVLKNTTSSSIAVVPKFIPLSGEAKGSYSLSPVTLAPNAETEVDINPLIQAARGRHDLEVVSVEVTNGAGPGSIIGSIYGVDGAEGVNYDVPLRDSGLVRTMTGSYPWKISDDFTTIVYITNISDQEAEFVGEVNYRGGHVLVEPRKLAPGETAVIDLQKFSKKQIIDRTGNKLARGVSLGQFKWAVHGVTNGKLLLIGRAEMVSRSQKISTSYSCNDPCPPYYQGSLNPFPPPVIIVNATGYASAWETAYYGNGYSYTWAAGASWSSDTSSVSLASQSVNTEAITGEIPGDACVLADMGREESYGWDGLNCYDNNNSYAVGETGCLVVPTTIRRLQYIAGGAGNQDILGTLYVLKGTTVMFNALPDPPAGTFASGEPTWSGSSGISGSGQTKSVTFNTTSTSASDFKTVVATAGNTMSVNVLVIELTSILTPDDNFSGRSQTNFGINERINLSATIAPSGVTAAAVGGIQWVQNSGNGALQAPTDGTGTYDAAPTAEAAVLQLTMFEGPSKSNGPTRSLTIVAPSDASVSKQTLSGIKHIQNFWSCGFLGDIFLSPKNVSFAGLFFKEEEIGATASGWLAFLNNTPHGANGQKVIGEGNSSFGCRVGADDEISSGAFNSADHGAYADGTLNWAIPWKYSVDGTNYTSLTTANETATSTATGKCSISKKGSGSFSAELGDPTADW